MNDAVNQRWRAVLYAMVLATAVRAKGHVIEDMRAIAATFFWIAVASPTVAMPDVAGEYACRAATGEQATISLTSFRKLFNIYGLEGRDFVRPFKGFTSRNLGYDPIDTVRCDHNRPLTMVFISGLPIFGRYICTTDEIGAEFSRCLTQSAEGKCVSEDKWHMKIRRIDARTLIIRSLRNRRRTEPLRPTEVIYECRRL